MEANPYAPPQAQILPGPTDAERIRREHIRTETTIKTAGVLYYLGGSALIVIGVNGLFAVKRAEDLAAPAVSVVVGVLFLLLGRGLRKLRRWVRVPIIILSAIGLLAFPLGTLINGKILSHIASKNGAMVLTPEYQDIIAVTRHVKLKNSKWVVLLLYILLGVTLFAIGAMWLLA